MCVHNVGKTPMLGSLTQNQHCVGWSGRGYLVWAIPTQANT